MELADKSTSRTEQNPEVDPHVNAHSTCNKVTQQGGGESMAFSISGAGATGYLYNQLWTFTPTSHHTLTSTPGGYRPQGKTIKLLGENQREQLQDLRVK